MSDPNLPLSKKVKNRGRKTESAPRRTKKYVTATETSPLIDQQQSTSTQTTPTPSKGCCCII